jgi:hypothetical protein
LGTLKFGFEFSERGDLFEAESSNAEWTRVIGKDGLVRFTLRSVTPSEFGLHPWPNKTAPHCLFKYQNGYILDCQKKRVLTFGNDGKPWLDEQKSGDDPNQKFEIILD